MIYRGFLRLILFTLVCIAFFALAGGHGHVLWQPFELLMIAGIYAVAMVGMRIKLYPFETSPENLRKVQNAGLAGLAASLLVPVVLGLIHTASFLTSGVEKIGMLMAASMVGIIYAISFYFCFFAGIDSLGHEPVVETERSKKVKAIAVPLFAGIGALTTVMFFAVMLMVLFESSSRPSYSDAQWDAISKATDDVDKEILELECKKGERVSYEVRKAMDDAAKERALASVKE